MTLRGKFTMYNLSYISRAKKETKNKNIPSTATLKTCPYLKEDL
jgi:hypothetical protein